MILAGASVTAAKRVAHVVAAGHVGDVEAHRGDFEHVALPQRVPGVHHAVMAEGDGDAVTAQLGHAGLPRRLG